MDIRDQYHDELCGLIERIAIDQDGWFNFSKTLLQRLDASYVHIQAIDFSHQAVSYSNGIGPLAKETYAAGELNYLRYPISDDPRWAQFLDPQRQGWYQCHHYVSDDIVDHSDLYQKILLPANLRYVASHELIRDEQLCVFWSISTALQRQPLNAEELDFLNTLLPRLKSVVQAQKHLYAFSLDNIVGYNLIDQLTQPILLLNLSGQVVYLNAAMQTYLDHSEVVNISDQHLQLPASEQTRFSTLLYQIEFAFRYDQALLTQYHAMQFKRSTGQHELLFNLNLMLSKKEMSFFGIRPLLMLVFNNSKKPSLTAPSNTQRKYDLSQSELNHSFKLSKREVEVCQLFVNGMKLEHIAQHCGLTIGSLRIYMKRIFAKTNTNSQTELMRLLLETAIKPEYFH